MDDDSIIILLLATALVMETNRVIYIDGEKISNELEFRKILKENRATAACTPSGYFSKRKCYCRFKDTPNDKQLITCTIDSQMDKANDGNVIDTRAPAITAAGVGIGLGLSSCGLAQLAEAIMLTFGRRRGYRNMYRLLKK